MRHFLAASVVLAALSAATPAFAVPLLTNGDFETGTFAGWTTGTQPSSNGLLSIDAPGTTTPVSGFNTAANPAGGNSYAVTDQAGPGAYAFAQSFTVPGPGAVQLSFDMFVTSFAGLAVNPAGLDFTAGPNQHARVDLLTSTASLFSTAPADVVANLYLGIDPVIGGPNPYLAYVIDLTPFVAPGGAYQLRFAEVDNQLFFNLGVDNVNLQFTPAQVGVPEPLTATLASLAFGALGAALLRRRR